MDGENKINLESNVDDSAQQSSQTVTNNPSTVVTEKNSTVNNNTSAVVAENATTEEPRRRYVDILNEMMPPDWKPMTEEERKAEEKKEKRDKIISAVGDGIMSLSNLFFTSRYAPNMYDAQKGMSETTRARWDKLKADREKNNQAYLAAYMNAAKMDDDAAVAERAWQYQLTRDKRADEMQDKQEARAAELHQLQVQLTNGQITRQQYENEVARLQMENAPEAIKLENEGKRAQIEANRASANASNVQSAIYNDGRFTTFSSTHGNYRIPNQSINDETLSGLFSKIPWKRRGKYYRKAQDPNSNETHSYVTKEDMLQAIGEDINSSDYSKLLKEALDDLVGRQSKKKPKGY